MNKEYKVRWTIDLNATDPVHAARLARVIQLDPESSANFFEVTEINRPTTEVDLDEEDQAEEAPND